MNNSPWPPKHQPISHRRPRLQSSLPLAAPVALGTVSPLQVQEVEVVREHLEEPLPPPPRLQRPGGQQGR